MNSNTQRFSRATGGVAVGVFCLGYTLGPGGIAKFGAAGASLGFASLAVVLAAGALFWTLLEATRLIAADGNQTVLYALRRRSRYGTLIGWALVAGVVLAHGTGLPVLISQLVRVVEPMSDSLSGDTVSTVLALAVLAACCAPGLMGNRGALLGFLAVPVVVMIAGAMILLGAIEGGVPIPRTETTPSAALGVLGIALALPTFLLRPLLLRGANASEMDSAISAAGLVVCGGAIAGAALIAPTAMAGGNVIEIADSLAAGASPLAYRCFVAVVAGAAVSSIVPMFIVLACLLDDFDFGELRIRSARSRGVIVFVAVMAVAGVLLGERMYGIHRLAADVAQIYFPPLAIGCIWFLVRRKASLALRVGMAACGVVSLISAVVAFVRLSRRFS